VDKWTKDGKNLKADEKRKEFEQGQLNETKM
jgi:hypothetical protein